MLQHYVNHVGLIIDRSGSMQGKEDAVVTVTDAMLGKLRQRSIDLNQETRISIYLFNAGITRLMFDMDVMRFKSIAGYYNPEGGTALIDATLTAIGDHDKIPQICGDHGFLMYVITDGENNRNNHLANALQTKIVSLPDNWTVACMVPDAVGIKEAKQFGFPTGSLAIWNVNATNAFESVGDTFTESTDRWMTMRSTGVRGTKSFFTMDSSNIRKSDLQKVNPASYDIFPVRKEQPIKEFVESWTRQPYRLRSAYYQPVKTVKIQDHKNILVQDTRTGTVYAGDNLRQLLGLPNHTVEVNPGSHKQFNIFVQSTSVNRKLFPETFLLVMKP